MNTYWDLLGLVPTSDLVAIKRAYASRLKSNRPDDDAEAYQNLRQAYELAQQYARFHHEQEAAHGDGGHTQEAVIAQENSSSSELAASPFVIAEPTFAVPPIATESPPSATDTPPGPEQPNIFTADFLDPDSPTGTAPENEIPQSISPEELMRRVREYCRRYGRSALPFYLDELQQLLDQIPFDMRDEINIRFVDFVLAEELPAKFIEYLVGYFGWGRDFRIDRLLGIEKSIRLSRCLDELIVSPEQKNALISKYKDLYHFSQLHRSGNRIKTWLFALLNPFVLATYIEPIPVLSTALGLDSARLSMLRQKALFSLAGLAAMLFILFGALQRETGMLKASWPNNTITLAVFFCLGYLSLVEFPTHLLRNLYMAFLAKPESCYIKNRHGKWMFGATLLYFIVATALSAYFPATQDAVREHPYIPAFLSIHVILAFAALAIIWPYGLTWEKIFFPLGAVLSAALAPALKEYGGYVTAISLAMTWIVLAQWLMIRKENIVLAVYGSFPRSLFPSSLWGWIRFVVFSQGVALIYGIALFLTGPLSLMAYSARHGWSKAFVALSVAIVLSIAGILPFSVWAFIFWLQTCLITFIGLQTVSTFILRSRYFQTPVFS
jgi:hypothetical protein